MLLWPKVCCFSWMLYTRCYCELFTNDFQDILVPMGAMYSALGNKKFLKSISIHFNCSFVQLKQQTSGHNNILSSCSEGHYYICMNKTHDPIWCAWWGILYAVCMLHTSHRSKVLPLQDQWQCPGIISNLAMPMSYSVFTKYCSVSNYCIIKIAYKFQSTMNLCTTLLAQPSFTTVVYSCLLMYYSNELIF